MGKRTTGWQMLDKALRTHKYEKAEQLLDALSAPIPGKQAAKLLNAALDCIPSMFEKVLSHCGHGERFAERELVIAGESGFVRGSFPLLAAAMGKCEHLRLLLDAGMDVNGAAEPPVQQFMQSDFFAADTELCVVPPDYKRDFRDCNVSAFSELAGGRRSPGIYRWHLEHCTPLAAAILCGQLECVELLLHRPGVRVAESEAVSSALLFYCKRSPQVIAAQRMVLRTLGDRPLRFAPSVFQLSAGRLAWELRRAHYDAAYFGKAAGVLFWYSNFSFSKTTIQRATRLLQMFYERAPELLDDPLHRDQLLSFLQQLAPTHPFFEWYLAHCGSTVDVEPILCSFFCSSQEGLSSVAALSERVECVLDRDAQLPPYSQRELRMLARYVRFLPSRFSGGLSVLTQRVLETGSARFVRWAVKKGWLCEPRRLMLQYLSEKHLDSLRATILLLPEPETDETLTPTKWEQSSPRWFPADERPKCCEQRIGG